MPNNAASCNTVARNTVPLSVANFLLQKRPTKRRAVAHQRSHHFRKYSVVYHDVFSAWYTQCAATGRAVAHKSSHHLENVAWGTMIYFQRGAPSALPQEWLLCTRDLVILKKLAWCTMMYFQRGTPSALPQERLLHTRVLTMLENWWQLQLARFEKRVAKSRRIRYFSLQVSFHKMHCD